MEVKEAMSTKHMTDEQARFISHLLYGNHDYAEKIRVITDSFKAHEIIAYCLRKAMMSDEDVKLYIKEQLGGILIEQGVELED